jgi:hypothetical protein
MDLRSRRFTTDESVELLTQGMLCPPGSRPAGEQNMSEKNFEGLFSKNEKKTPIIQSVVFKASSKRLTSPPAFTKPTVTMDLHVEARFAALRSEAERTRLVRGHAMDLHLKAKPVRARLAAFHSARPQPPPPRRSAGVSHFLWAILVLILFSVGLLILVSDRLEPVSWSPSLPLKMTQISLSNTTMDNTKVSTAGAIASGDYCTSPVAESLLFPNNGLEDTDVSRNTTMDITKVSTAGAIDSGGYCTSPVAESLLLPNNGLEDTDVSRNFYDAVLSGYLYHKAGNECLNNWAGPLNSGRDY